MSKRMFCQRLNSYPHMWHVSHLTLQYRIIIVGHAGAINGTRTTNGYQDLGVTPFYEGTSGRLGENGFGQMELTERSRSSGRCF